MDLGQVFTGKIVADYMVSLFSDKNIKHILEPCFGGGSFLKACLDAGYKEIDGCEIDKKLYESTAQQYPMYNLLCQDFLSYVPSYEYDGVIMNPPYVRQEKIDDLKELGITKDLLKKNPIYAGLPSTANLYMYFIIKAIDLLRIGGELIVIFPSSWMQARSGEEFKEQLFSNADLLKEIHIRGEVFEKEALVEVVILKLVKTENPSKTKCDSSYMELVDGKLIEKVISHNDFQLPLDTPFSKYSKIRRGLTTGWNTMFINPKVSIKKNRKFIKPIISTPKDVAGYNTDSAITDNLLVIAPGQKLNIEMKNYIKAMKEQLRRDKKHKTLYEKAESSKEWYTLNPVDSDGILFSYFVRNDMKFIMNTANILARDNFYIIYPLINKYLMFALLNNYYTYYQLEVIGKKYGAGLLKIQRYDIENLKFVDVDRISVEDNKHLIFLATELANESKTDNIEEITKVLSKYSNIDFERIAWAYKNVKGKRLEAS